MGNKRLPMMTPTLARALPAAGVARRPQAAEFVGPLLARMRQSWSRSPTLADCLAPERNSFGVIRLILAMAVLISHAVFLQSGSDQAEPLVALTGYSLGQYGVQGFFILSGILVTQSLINRGDLFDYGRARVMRIVPGLVVCVLATALLAGPALSALGAAAYFGSPELATYIAKTLTLSTGSAHLPALFDRNPASGLVNQSLWTLKYEVACYGLLAGVTAITWQFKAQRAAVALAMGAWAALMVSRAPNLHHDGNFLDSLTYFALFFGAGVAASLLRRFVRLNWQPLPVLGVLFVLSWHTPWAEPASAALLGFGLLWLATFTFGPLRAATSANDYSYGTYIYSYPVSQALLQTWPELNTVSLIAATVALTLGFAWLSWRCVERPALARVHRWRARHRLMTATPLHARAGGGSRAVARRGAGAAMAPHHASTRAEVRKARIVGGAALH